MHIAVKKLLLHNYLKNFNLKSLANQKLFLQFSGSISLSLLIFDRFIALLCLCVCGGGGKKIPPKLGKQILNLLYIRKCLAGKVFPKKAVSN